MDLQTIIQYLTQVRDQHLVAADLDRATILGRAIRVLREMTPEPDLPPLVRLMVEEILEHEPEAQIHVVHVSGD